MQEVFFHLIIVLSFNRLYFNITHPLFLPGNNIGGSGARKMSKALMFNTTLTNIDLGGQYRYGILECEM